MATFPRLRTGAVTQYPSAKQSTHSTCITRFVDGSEQRFRELKSPVRRWLIRLSNVSSEEANSIEELFYAMQGQFGSFTFIDPWDDTEYPDCSFDQDTLSIVASDDVQTQTSLVVRNNAL